MKMINRQDNELSNLDSDQQLYLALVQGASENFDDPVLEEVVGEPQKTVFKLADSNDLDKLDAQLINLKV